VFCYKCGWAFTFLNIWHVSKLIFILFYEGIIQSNVLLYSTHIAFITTYSFVRAISLLILFFAQYVPENINWHYII
jgi:hypothetical protein